LSQTTDQTTPATTAASGTGSPSGAPVDAIAGTANGKGVGNPRDIQGILALTITGGTLGIGAVAIYLSPANALQVFTTMLGITGTIVGYYFGARSQQT
jgi:hypothetical protein